jgi:predicted ATPase with chaperone activity
MRSALLRGSRRASSCTSSDVLGSQVAAECEALAAAGGRLHWVFLGAPGVGKGTYASRVAKLLGVPHISAGDLVRDEIKAGTALAKQARPPLRAAAAAPFFACTRGVCRAPRACAPLPPSPARRTEAVRRWRR